MAGKPVTIRLLDPPLHEFVPVGDGERTKLAEALGMSMADLDRRADELHELNPMLGHRGVRLGVTYPEITEMQFRAILEAAAELRAEGVEVQPEIMVPVVGMKKELEAQLALAKKVHAEVCEKYGVDEIDHLYGTMIEIPRACLTADEIAETAEFFSFGTNDLTQMTFGFSRDDIGGFLPEYLDQQDPRRRSLPGARPRRRRPAGRDGHREGPHHQARPQGRHLRRARRRAELGRVLPQGRHELRQLQPLPRADRPPRGGPGSDSIPKGLTVSTQWNKTPAHRAGVFRDVDRNRNGKTSKRQRCRSKNQRNPSRRGVPGFNIVLEPPSHDRPLPAQC